MTGDGLFDPDVDGGEPLGHRLTVDGITYDRYGNPVSYRVLRAHPEASLGGDGAAYSIPAANMLHIFNRLFVRWFREWQLSNRELPLVDSMSSWQGHWIWPHTDDLDMLNAAHVQSISRTAPPPPPPNTPAKAKTEKPNSSKSRKNNNSSKNSACL